MPARCWKSRDGLRPCPTSPNPPQRTQPWLSANLASPKPEAHTDRDSLGFGVPRRLGARRPAPLRRHPPIRASPRRDACRSRTKILSTANPASETESFAWTILICPRLRFTQALFPFRRQRREEYCARKQSWSPFNSSDGHNLQNWKRIRPDISKTASLGSCLISAPEILLFPSPS